MITLIGLAILAVAAPKEVVPEPSSHPEWSQVRAEGEEFLKRELIDPESARIKWTKGFEWTSWKQGNTGMFNKRRWGWLACGTLNAKNRFGGYVGEQRVVMAVGADGTMRAGMAHSIESHCSYDSDRFGLVVPELSGR